MVTRQHGQLSTTAVLHGERRPRPVSTTVSKECDLLMDEGISMTKLLSHYARRKVTRRLMWSVPWIGAILALATLGSAIRRKGFLGGSLDTALDMMPFVGGLKNLAEAGRGRDFIRDRGTVEV